MLEGVDPWSLITFQAKDLKSIGWEYGNIQLKNSLEVKRLLSVLAVENYKLIIRENISPRMFSFFLKNLIGE